MDMYNYHIYNRYKNLLNAQNSHELSNHDLSKIFEYYSCIKLTAEYKNNFYEYGDIHPEYKEKNRLTRYDSGIDCCDLGDTIVQCKLRKTTLSWKECSTFFASQNMYDEHRKETIVKWKKLIITRNDDCKLTYNLRQKYGLFVDNPYNRDELIKYCEKLLLDHPFLHIEKKMAPIVRDYQQECIDLIMNGTRNIIISLPTGTGKNFIIIHSLEPHKKYLILVPKIILMEQINDEINKYNPTLGSTIQLIGDGNNNFDENKCITICVYNSVKIIHKYVHKFNKIFVDEAHHINTPEIYKNYDDCENNENTEDVDEIKSTSHFDIIKSFSKFNNNIYLSATIDEQDGFEYYVKDIRDMIDKKYLCDYTINIPIFEHDPTDRNICEYLLKEHRNIIIYCDSHNEGKKINNLLNTLQKNSSEYVDCNTSKSQRKTILDRYKSGELPFIVNVRILIEGFDAPIAQGVCFMHMPSSKTTLIQIIGRALRPHFSKSFAKIILPFSSDNNDDISSIKKFMEIMAKNDRRIRQSFEKKIVGGYISLEKHINPDDRTACDKDIDFKYELIFNSLGIVVGGKEIWIGKLDGVKNYMCENKKRPSEDSKDKMEKIMGRWISHQLTNYKNKKYIMINDDIRKIWEEFVNSEEYSKYFMSNEKIWIDKCNKLKKIIDDNGRKPKNNESEAEVFHWLAHQPHNYMNHIGLMENSRIRKMWEDFINDEKYNKYFMSNETTWKENRTKLITYMEREKDIPHQRSKKNDDDTEQLANWVCTQKSNYEKKAYIMADDEIRKMWEDLIKDKKYFEYFLSLDEKWVLNLNGISKFIDDNKKLPSGKSPNKYEKYLGNWLFDQIKNSKNGRHHSCVNTGENRQLWEKFIDKYSKYFLSQDDKWVLQLNDTQRFIDANKRRASDKSVNENEKKIGMWVYRQIASYNKNKMVNGRKLMWEKFIEMYSKYFNNLSK
jgi:superfamily II DNA or RNA helicase